MEVFRSNMSYEFPPLDYQAHALIAVGGAEESTFFYHRVNPKLFVNGTNVIAVEIHQSDLTSSDLSFDCELTGNVSGPNTGFNISAGQRATIRCVDHPDSLGSESIPNDLGLVPASRHQNHRGAAAKSWLHPGHLRAGASK